MDDTAADVEAIKQLKARYFRLMDTKDWDAMAQVFAPDVEIDMTGEDGTVHHGVDDFMPYLRANIELVITVHHGHMPEITLLSETTARGIWAMEDKLWWPEGSPLVHLHGYGHYHETYEKTGGQWRIKTLTLTRLHRQLVTAKDAGSAG
ncbi:MAG TPA: nuclear transport factor 2 family protein [Frankiaceae bacterium]|jgi:hypothetical protein|nr:nuclear transport factor 2 family protein [Frankiaceae bacterium]